MRAALAVGITLLTLSILSGVFYVLGVVLWSGESVQEVERPEGAMRFAEPIVLDPAMNPLRATLEASYLQASRLADLFATVTLTGPDGREVWTRRLRVDDSEGGAGWTSTSMPVHRFDVEAAGPHRLEVRLEQAYGGQFRAATVSLRRNVQTINWLVVAGIVGAGLVGLAWTIVADRVLERRKIADA